jgi:hypothetical protein
MHAAATAPMLLLASSSSAMMMVTHAAAAAAYAPESGVRHHEYPGLVVLEPSMSQQQQQQQHQQQQQLLLLFTDRAQVAHMDSRLEARVNQPTKGPMVIAPTEPWESYGISAWTSVLRVSPTEDRMYYDCIEGSIRGPGRRVCLAISTDGGITWHKPVLNVFNRTWLDPVAGVNRSSTANNIVVEAAGNGVFIDGNPAAPASEKWKMVSDAAFASPDGLHWTRMGRNGSRPTRQMDDTKPTGAWDPRLRKYVIYVRRDVGGRHIGRCVTSDFTNWESESPQGCPIVFGADSHDKAADSTMDVYTNSWTPYPSITTPVVHLFFPSIFHHFGSGVPFHGYSADGILDLRLVTSRDGSNLSYTDTQNGRSSFVPLGINDCTSTPTVAGGWCDPETMQESKTSFDTSAMYAASGYLQSHDGHFLHLYSAGQPNTHGNWHPGTAPGGMNGWGNNTGVRLLRLRKDGFVSIDAPYPTSHELTQQPSLTTVVVTVPTGCAPPTHHPMPPAGPTKNVTCSYLLPGQTCRAQPRSAGWHNVSCITDRDCQNICGTCHCHGKSAMCRLHPSESKSYCDTGAAGGMICHHNSFGPNRGLPNNTFLKGGVQLLLNVETSVVGFVAVEVLEAASALPVAGMSAADSDVIKGSSVHAIASWGAGKLRTLSHLAGQDVKLRVVMADAKLFAVRLACASQKQ